MLLIALVAATCCATRLFAQAPGNQTPKPELIADSAAEINAVLDGKATSFSTIVTVTLSGGASRELELSRKDHLREDGGGQPIDRANISWDGGLLLVPGEPRDVRITIQNISQPGTYRTSITLGLKGESRSGKAVSLVLKAVGVPALRATQPSISLQSTQTNLADRLLLWAVAPTSKEKQRQLFVENTGLGPTTAAPVINVINAPTPPSDAIGIVPASSSSIPPNTLGTYSLVVKPERLVPGRYEGTVRFMAPGAAAPAATAFTINVRCGPFIPALIILLGVIFGRAIQAYSAPAVQQRIALLDRLSAVHRSALGLRDPTAKTIFLGQVQELIRRVNGPESTETLSPLVATAEQNSALLASFDRVEELLGRLPDSNPHRPPGFAAVAAGRSGVLQGDFAAAKRYFDVAQKEATDGLLDSVPRVITFRSQNEDNSSESSDRSKPTDGPDSRALVTIEYLAGVRAPNPQIARRWLRPIFFSLLLLVLAITGFVTLYLSSSAVTLGAGGPLDFVPLFLWGLGADVVQRTLQNVGLSIA